jgi:hypothetical protein
MRGSFLQDKKLTSKGRAWVFNAQPILVRVSDRQLLNRNLNLGEVGRLAVLHFAHYGVDVLPGSHDEDCSSHCSTRSFSRRLSEMMRLTPSRLRFLRCSSTSCKPHGAKRFRLLPPTSLPSAVRMKEGSSARAWFSARVD